MDSLARKKTWTVLLLAIMLMPVFLAACGSQPEVATTDMLVAATLTRELGENQEPLDPTDTFAPEGPFHISLEIEGRPKTGTVSAAWYLANEFIAEASVELADVNGEVLASVGENTYVGFTLTPDQPFPDGDEYRVETFLNEESLGEYSFAVSSE